MSKSVPPERYQHLITLAESHYARRGFVKWTDLATELGLSRQRILQMLQQAICLGYITEDDLDRYRSEAARRAASRTNRALRRDLERLKLQVVLTPDNLRWLDSAHAAAPHGSTRSDLINTAITHYRTHE
jgi:Mn-dependent DtxR family transcriptional regulator